MLNAKEIKRIEEKKEKFSREGRIILGVGDVDYEVENWINFTFPNVKMFPHGRRNYERVVYVRGKNNQEV